jgi:hypothetical protein
MLIFNQDEFLNKLKRIRESFFFFLHECPLAAAGIFFLVSLGLYAGVYWGTLGISFQDDHFFHFKLAYLLRTEGFGILNNFDWIYLTKTAQEHLRYPISLFQIALVPFTFFKDMVLGLKVSDIFWASLSVSIIFYVLLKMKTKFPIFSMLVLLSSFVFFISTPKRRTLKLKTLNCNEHKRIGQMSSKCSIYTKTGDGGETSLVSGTNASKTSWATGISTYCFWISGTKTGMILITFGTSLMVSL